MISRSDRLGAQAAMGSMTLGGLITLALVGGLLLWWASDRPQAPTLSSNKSVASGGLVQQPVPDPRVKPVPTSTQSLPVGAEGGVPGWPNALREASSLEEDEPLELGEPLDAEDTAEWVSEEDEDTHMEVGEPLDADDPEDWIPDEDEDEPIGIGDPLDADDSKGWMPAKGGSVPINIGGDLDVGGGYGMVPNLR